MGFHDPDALRVGDRVRYVRPLLASFAAAGVIREAGITGTITQVFPTEYGSPSIQVTADSGAVEINDPSAVEKLEAR